MNTLTIPPVNENQRPKSPRQLDSSELGRLKHKIERNTQCEILFSQFDRGRYATDASHYQIFPIGVVIPTTRDDLRALIDIATNLTFVSRVAVVERAKTDKPSTSR